MAMEWSPRRLEAAAILGVQAALLIVTAAVATYDSAEQRRAPPDADVVNYYSMFQDVHVMMAVGFGFLMTFLRRYGYSAVVFNLLLVAVLSQWAVLCKGFYDRDPEDGLIHIGLPSILGADLTVATVLISMGAVLGKVSPLQLLVMGLVETAICTANEHLGLHVFKASDAGGSMFVHAFGAYFGLAVSVVLAHGATIRRRTKSGDNSLEGASYTSDLFSMVGTVFLWCFWPSFNGALTAGDERTRAIINTYLALGASTAVAIAASAFFSRDSKISMVHAQNATLAGGVAVGTACNMMLQPAGAVTLGAAAGAISTLGFRYVQPWLVRRLAVHDTCGVHNLHGMPALLAGLAATAAAAAASEDSYGASLYRVFEARGTQMSGATQVDGRTAGAQAGFQLLALAVTVGIALVTGAITGFLLRLPVLDRTPLELWFSDASYWELPEEGWTEENSQVASNGGVDNRALEDDPKTRESPLSDSQLHI